MGEFTVWKKGPSVLALALGGELAGASENVGSFLSLSHPSICCTSESILTHLRWCLVGHPCWLVSPSVDPFMSLSGLPSLGRSFIQGLWLLIAPQTLSCWPYCLAYCSPAPCALLVPFWRPHHKYGKNLPCHGLLLLWLSLYHLSERKLELTHLHFSSVLLFAVLFPHSFG